MNYGIPGIYDIPYNEAILGESQFYASGTETNGIALKSATMILKGAITYQIKYALNKTIADKEVYVEYVIKGVTKEIPLVKESDGNYYAYADGNAAKDMDEVVTFKAFYYGEDGEKVYGLPLVYSGYEYTRRTLVSTKVTEVDKALAKAFAMYVYCADIDLS